jgi:hypothetical protein
MIFSGIGGCSNLFICFIFFLDHFFYSNTVLLLVFFFFFFFLHNITGNTFIISNRLQ